jgi:hypothetical protein
LEYLSPHDELTEQASGSPRHRQDLRTVTHKEDTFNVAVAIPIEFDHGGGPDVLLNVLATGVEVAPERCASVPLDFPDDLIGHFRHGRIWDVR